MYKSLKIRGYRSLKSLDMDGLTRVNLIVGRNNAGKTSLLDAIEILSKNGEDGAIFQSSKRRTEYAVDSGEGEVSPYENSVRWDVSNFFYGRNVKESVSFSIEGKHKKNEKVTCSVGLFLRSEIMTDEDLFEQSIPALIVEHSPRSASSKKKDKLYFEIGKYDSVAEPRRYSQFKSDSINRVNYISPNKFTGKELAIFWDSIVLTPAEDLVVDVLRIVEPDVDRIAFVRGRGREVSIYASMKNNDRRIALGSMGDGMMRILTIAIMLVNSKDGYLLIDEIDSGLHYSVLESVWRFVIETAKTLNVQVFATTHSEDCINALAWLFESDEALASEASLHKLEFGGRRVIRYTSQNIQQAISHKVEVR